MARKIIRRRIVEERTGLCRSDLYAKIARGEFPKPVRLGPQAVGWVEAEVEAWIADRIAERDTGRAA